ncbi:MAG: ATP-binding cassette domain-containing protein [Pseudomonadota bacterium]|nr:ATP-binding cassette domain-containing protein [Pseudomonadota bacterium]
MNGRRIDLRYERGDFHLCLDLELPESGLTAILGPSGSGKSTLLRLIAGLEQPQQGRIQVAGSLWLGIGQGVRLPTQRRRVGMVFQDYALFANMSVVANIGYGLPRAGRKQAVAEWIERLHPDGLQARHPHQLSGGQKQRVALAPRGSMSGPCGCASSVQCGSFNAVSRTARQCTCSAPGTSRPRPGRATAPRPAAAAPSGPNRRAGARVAALLAADLIGCRADCGGGRHSGCRTVWLIRDRRRLAGNPTTTVSEGKAERLVVSPRRRPARG